MGTSKFSPMDNTHKQEYHIRDLATRSVTLFPSRAQVVREIKNVLLKTGTNQIVITGLTPTTDEASIKLEGTGSATITDIAIDLLPNPDNFQDVYPETGDEGSSDQSDSDPEPDGKEQKNEELEATREKIGLLKIEEMNIKEILNSADSRMQILDAYGKTLTMDREHPVDVKIDEGIKIYRMEREKMFKERMVGVVKEREITEKIAELMKEEQRLNRAASKEMARAMKAKAKAAMTRQKEAQKEARKKQRALEGKRRIQRERELFWPRKTYTVKVSLDTTNFSPANSRRSSISSDIVHVSHAKDFDSSDEEGCTSTCDLALSYMTTDAKWQPSYDLTFSTTANTGLLYFDALLTNHTSETWSNCKMMLSTSQTDVSNLNEPIPTLIPWRVQLMSPSHVFSSVAENRDILYSPLESATKGTWFPSAAMAQKSRSELFGVGSSSFLEEQAAQTQAQSYLRTCGYPGMTQNVGRYAVQTSGSAFGSTSNTAGFGSARSNTAGAFGGAGSSNTATGSLFGSAQASRPAYGGLFGGSTQAFGQSNTQKTVGGLFGHGQSSAAQLDNTEMDAEFPDDSDTPKMILPELRFQESTFEETGFVATFDLPGVKTLAPSSTASKQRVLRFDFGSVQFKHTVVPKYKRAAFLEAKFKNGSGITFPEGSAGLSLDGSFHGRIKLPRCGAGEPVNISLGTDPAITVSYPKPEVTRSQSGLLSLAKEHRVTCTRTITLVNARSAAGAKPVQVQVLDHIPVSEDKRLRIDILQPKGLIMAEGDGAGDSSSGVNTGIAAKASQGGKGGKDWGKATALSKKNGEVTWEVTLNAGRGVKLDLEYDCAFPAGEQVVSAKGM